MLALFFVGVIAGVIEASAGGSGLISLPAIMYLGYQPIEAIATSKFQYAFGALTAIGRYARAGLISWRKLTPMLIGSVVAGALGAYMLTRIDTEIVALIMPIFLVGIAIYFLCSPRFSDEETSPRITLVIFGLIIVPIIAFYDGFFGVGSASLYMTAFVLLLGMNVRSATANTKLLDFASGVAALAVLAAKGYVLLIPGLLLSAGQVIGSHFGSTFVIKWGVRWVKPLIVFVTIALSIDLFIRHHESITLLLRRIFQP